MERESENRIASRGREKGEKWEKRERAILIEVRPYRLKVNHANHLQPDAIYGSKTTKSHNDKIHHHFPLWGKFV